MSRQGGRLREILIAVLIGCMCAVLFVRQYSRAEIVKLYPPLPRKTGECQNKFLTYFWNQTVTERIKQPPGFDCSSDSDPLVTKRTLTIREVLDSGYFEGLAECPKRVPHFSDKSLPNIALASFPGSGNTWARHLIEQFSEIYTGSVYCSGIIRNTFKAECARTRWSYTMVIKTHRTDKLDYDGAVLLIRNPYKAIFAEYNRVRKGKRGTVRPEAFQTSSWKNAVTKQAVKWGTHVGTWLSDFKGPVHILIYERLLTDFNEEIYTLASFLNVTVTYGDLWCLNQNREGRYHRKKVVEPVFTSEQKMFVDKIIQDVNIKLKKRFHRTLPY